MGPGSSFNAPAEIMDVQILSVYLSPSSAWKPSGHHNISCPSSQIHLFFWGVLARAGPGSQWDPHKGHPRPDPLVSCPWADHSQHALTPPKFSSVHK